MAETKQTQGREEEADAALRTTAFGRGAAAFLVGIFLLTILAVPLIQARFGTFPKMAAQKIPTGAQLKAYEKSLETSSTTMAQVRPLTQQVLTQAFRAGNEQVLLGGDGWLFYRQGVDSLAGEGFMAPRVMKARLAHTDSQPDPIAAILDFKAQLDKRGIRLIVAPAPDKATIYPEKLWPHRNVLEAPPQNPSFEQFKRALEAKGVLVYDATETLWRAKTHVKTPQFFPLDTHWTPPAVDLVARDLAALIGNFAALPPREPVPYARAPEGGADPHDLLRLLGLPKNQKLLHETPVEARAVYSTNGRLVMPDAHADVLLLGDSFSGVFYESGAGLVQQLGFYLQRPIDQVSVPNGGSWGARWKMYQQMQAGNDRLAGKKLVIYEFVARDLAFGNWKKITFPAPKTAPLPTPTSTPTATSTTTPLRAKQSTP